MRKPIILIGGTAGTGKTTLARELCYCFRIDHRLGTGFVREVVKSQFSERTCPELYQFTFRSENPVNHLLAQARRVHTAIASCIRRARSEGTSLVIEGNHLVPELYHDADVSLYLVLSAPDAKEHFRRLQGPSHIKRTITSTDVEKVRQIDEYLRAEAQKYAIAYLPYADNLTSFVELINGKI